MKQTCKVCGKEADQPVHTCIRPPQSDTPRRADVIVVDHRPVKDWNSPAFIEALLDGQDKLQRENAALKERAERAEKEATEFWQTMDAVLPRVRELTRTYKERYGAAHAQDFDDAIRMLEESLERKP